jgi:hypothetical protein
VSDSKRESAIQRIWGMMPHGTRGPIIRSFVESIATEFVRLEYMLEHEIKKLNEQLQPPYPERVKSTNTRSVCDGCYYHQGRPESQPCNKETRCCAWNSEKPPHCHGYNGENYR